MTLRAAADRYVWAPRELYRRHPKREWFRCLWCGDYLGLGFWAFCFWPQRALARHERDCQGSETEAQWRTHYGPLTDAP
jgi:hypothetical protein